MSEWEEYDRKVDRLNLRQLRAALKREARLRYDATARCELAEYRLENTISALKAITGGYDVVPWTDAYRNAGGGYEGLQAIAEAALLSVGGALDEEFHNELIERGEKTSVKRI